MEVVVNARHAEVSPTLREATRKKVGQLERFASDVRLVEVEFSDETTRRNDHAHTCEILIHLRRRLVKGVASAAEQAVALDVAIEKVTQQMRRLHERRLDARHGGPHRNSRGVTSGAANSGAANPKGAVNSTGAVNSKGAPSDLDLDLELALDGDDDGSDGELEIVRTKRFSTKPMAVEEAALQMELLGHDFFLFTSTESGRCAVVYRRRDGRLGLIEATG